MTTIAPLKTLCSDYHQVELYPDHLVVQHTDWVSKMFSHEDVVDLNDIREIRLYDSRFLPGKGLQLVIIGKAAKTIRLGYPISRENEVHEFKTALENLLKKA